MSHLPKPQKGQYKHFGDVLRHYRETISDRLQQFSPGLVPIHVSALDLIKCLRSQGYHVSPASYSSLENGDSLPRDPELFLTKIGKCLAIERGSLEWWTLTLYAMHGLMSQKLGPRAADAAIPISEPEIRNTWQNSLRSKEPE